MTYWKILAGLVGVLAIVAGIHTVAGWREDAAILKACAAAVAIDAPPAADPGRACPSSIAVAALAANRARACDAAFRARPENTYGVAAACTEPVKTVQAERDVARREAGRLTQALSNERLGQDAAIARATASASTQAERKARAAAALQAAPRDGDGLVVCAADCMRARWASASERP
ncbi:hypothetical protein [Caulobacter sp. BP25]|uniref:hypothetical protein n=1 Tax=Caulobacter sp. BP25 TaxID=2048900 RepID=UPI000C12A6AD|nr:hypothetical protein [Caulobacter sp. BP25]PHY20799.1 hypothetical protein CSW59_06130 [Caulobacter sp. BP25]